MNTIHSQGICADCIASESSGELHRTVEQIGRPVDIERTISRGYDLTEYFFYQCFACGSVWMKILDSGITGHQAAYHRVTKGMF